jgi:subtilisin family serine protease
MTPFPRCFGIFGGLVAALGVCTALACAQELSREAQARFASQVSVLESEKASRTLAQQKLDSAIIFGLPSEQAKVSALTAFRTAQSLKADAATRLKIEGEITGNLLLAIRRADGEVLESFPNLGVVYAKLTPAQAETIAALPEVKRISVPAPAVSSAAKSEGDRTHRADNARSNYSATGKGIKIGVLSDSVDYLLRSQNAGELPANVTVLPGQAGTPDANGNRLSGEGTAMLEIVHDLAPDAQLYFATAFTSEEQFAQNILDLRAAGCNIIVDDVIYLDEPPFQDGPVAKAVNQVVNDGALYFAAATNFGGQNDGTSGCWEGDFKASTQTLPDGQGGTLHDWSGNAHNAVQNLASTGTYGFLFWSDPLGASTNDYDLYIVNKLGEIVATSNTTQDGTQDPLEYTTIYPGDKAVVRLFKGSPRFLHFEVFDATLNFKTQGRTRGHVATENCIGVAAAPANAPFQFGQPQGPYPKAFSSSNTTETFSSDGPRKMFYAPDGTPFTGGFLNADAKKLLKPDITAADGVSTSVPGFQPFFGTSAASPHAAAIAAQIWSVDPTQTAAQVKAALFNSAIDIRTSGWDRDSGYGIVMAAAAVKAVSPGITISPVTVKETTSTEYADFPVTLTKAAIFPIVIQFQTEDITAKGTADYRTKRGEVTIAAGETKATIRVPVYADNLTENTETFRVKLLSATNARLDTATAIGTILDSSSTTSGAASAKSAGKF